MKQIALEQVRIHHTYAEAAAQGRIHAIKLARDVGLSWDAIGEAMGMSRQTAHKRYGAAVGEPNHSTRKATARLENYANGGPMTYGGEPSDLPDDPAGPVDS